MNIKKGLNRIWIVVSVLWVVGFVGQIIYTFPEQPKETKPVEVNEGGFQLDASAFEGLGKTKEELYDEEKKKSLLLLLYGLGGLVFMWVSLYTGIWITSGFTNDKKKDETNE